MKHCFFKSGLFVAVLAAGLLAGCTEKEEGPVTLGIRTEGVGGTGAKVIMDNLTPKWEGGEQVKINADTKTVAIHNADTQLNGVASASSYRAVYPASIVTTADLSASASVSVTLPSTQVYREDASGHQQVTIPMGTYLNTNTGTLAFKNLCSLVKVRVTNSQGCDLVIKSIALRSSAAGLCGSGTVTLDGGSDPVIALSNQNSKRILLTMGAAGVAVNAGSSKDFYFVVPAFSTASQMEFTVTALSTDNGTAYTYTKSSATTLTLARNTVANASLPVSGATTTAAPSYTTAGGIFAVSPTKSVRFASGNLIYSEATGLFRFDTSQYAFSTARNGSGEWEYFGWSTPATFFGMSTSTSNADYSGDFVDWGTQLGNGTTWRTLSSGEWGHLFNSRSGAVIKVSNKANTADSLVAGNARYAEVQVCGKNGIILFPDAGSSFVWPTGVETPTIYNTYVNNSAANAVWNDHNYTYAEWHALEAADCVFLPAAGYRNGTSVSNAGSSGYYWSSAPNGAEGARLLSFGGTYVNPQGNNYRDDGFAVRLVQDQN